MTPRWLDDAEQAAWRHFLDAQIRLNDRLDRELRAAHDLGLDDYEVLVHLSEQPDLRLRMSDLADRLVHSRSRLTYRVDRMVQTGYLTREQCPDDKRGTFAVITPLGLELLATAAPTHVDGVRRHLTDQMSRDEFLQLGAVLGRVAEQLRSEGD
ncbi:MAG: MarR family transcriptional regulator [Actinomycetota bacterium]